MASRSPEKKNWDYFAYGYDLLIGPKVVRMQMWHIKYFRDKLLVVMCLAACACKGVVHGVFGVNINWKFNLEEPKFVYYMFILIGCFAPELFELRSPLRW